LRVHALRTPRTQAAPPLAGGAPRVAAPSGKRVVQLRLPVNAAALAADDDDEARARFPLACV
jgi:hypothetical protein